jgi:Kelch motif protein
MNIAQQLFKIISQPKFVLLFLLAICFLYNPTKAHAFAAPSWWNGNQCDSTHYTSVNIGDTPVLFTTWSGIQSCGYGLAQNPYNWPDVAETMPGSSIAENEWQCTELVKRYLYLAFGVPSQSGTNGDAVVATYASNFPTMFQSISNTNGNSGHVWPKVGDVLSYSDVHTAIITGVTVTDATNGNATLTLLEQNASQTGTTTQQFVGWVIKGDIDDPNDLNSDTVTAWLTPTAAHLTWTNEGSMVWEQYGQGSVLLPDGKVLIAGGTYISAITNHTQLYSDGSGGTGSWASKAGMNAARRYFVMQPVTVSGGGSRVLAASGVNSTTGVLNSAELYNESANTWTTTPTMNVGRYNAASSILSDGRVLVTGGSTNTAETTQTTSAEIYDPSANTWSAVSSMSGAREVHQQVTFTDSSGNSKVMVIGGYKYGTGTLSSTEIYDPSANTWSAGPSLNYARNTFQAVLLHDGRILVVGSDSPNKTKSEVYSPSTNSWTVYTTPYIEGSGSQAIVLGINTNYKVLVVGISGGSGSTNAMLFDPVTNSWSTTTSLNTARSLPSLTLLSNGNALVAGGTNSSAYLKSSEEYTP